MIPAVAVIAKAPQPGRSKTRLCPPLTPAQAAVLAEAALRDTLAEVAAIEGARKVILLDGHAGPWLPDDFEVLGQAGGGLDERLANAFADLAGPALIIAMDTPQVRRQTLQTGLERLADSPAVLGPTADGGYWAVGLQRPDPRALLGVPMSTPHTLRAQRTRLLELGLRVAELERLRDVDTFLDAVDVAASTPSGMFAAALADLHVGRAAA